MAELCAMLEYFKLCEADMRSLQYQGDISHESGYDFATIPKKMLVVLGTYPFCGRWNGARD